MNDTRYPTRMHEVLGVETGEVFDCEGRTWTISESGVLSIVNKIPGCYEVVGPSAVCLMINHPERITRRPWLTDEQAERLKAWLVVGFRWMAKDKEEGYICVYVSKPKKCEEAEIWVEGGKLGYVIGPEKELVSWSDPEPLDIVQTLRDAGRLEGE